MKILSKNWQMKVWPKMANEIKHRRVCHDFLSFWVRSLQIMSFGKFQKKKFFGKILGKNYDTNVGSIQDFFR